MDQSVTSIRKTRRFAEKREAILAAATRLFNQNGVKGVSLAAVAESVDLLTPSVTYYFRKKEDLAAACLLRSIAVFDDLFRAAGGESEPSSRLKACLRLYFEFRPEIALGRRPAPMQFDDIRALATPAREPVIAAYQIFRRARACLTRLMPICRAAARAMPERIFCCPGCFGCRPGSIATTRRIMAALPSG